MFQVQIFEPDKNKNNWFTMCFTYSRGLGRSPQKPGKYVNIF